MKWIMISFEEFYKKCIDVALETNWNKSKEDLEQQIINFM